MGTETTVKNAEAIVFNFSTIREAYDAKMNQFYEDNFYKVVHEYQDTLDSHDIDKSHNLVGIQAILNQPSRQPSYTFLDLDDNGKKEMYILFDDGKSAEFELLAAYAATFIGTTSLNLETIDQEILQRKVNQQFDKDLYKFDVDELLTMNYDSLSSGDYSDIDGKWITSDGTPFSIKFGKFGVEMMNVRTKNEMFKSDSSQGLIFGDVQDGQFKGKFTDGVRDFELTFLPAGIQTGESDKSYDRIYYAAENLYFYRYDEIIDSIEKVPLDIIDILDGDFTSLAGTWRNSSDTRWHEIIIDESGILQYGWGDFASYPIEELQVVSGGFLYGRITTGKNGTGSSIAVIPAGVEVAGARNADENRDRIAIGDPLERYNDPQVFYRVED